MTGSRVNRVVQVGVFAAFLIVGPALLAWGASDVSRHETLVEVGVRAEGMVVAFADSNRASQREVDVEFLAEDARTYTAYALADSTQHPDVGATLTVAYDRDDPENNAVVGYETSGSSLLGMGVILTLIPLGLLALVGVGVVMSGRRARRRARAKPAGHQPAPTTGDE